MADISQVSKKILDFWFGDGEPMAKSKLWFGSTPEIDAEIKEKFEDNLKSIDPENLDAWGSDPMTALSLVVLLDQFPRNIYRDQGQAFAFDKTAQAWVLKNLSGDNYHDLPTPIHKWFFAMPLMHSESIEHQKMSVLAFSVLKKNAPEEYAEMMASVVTHAVRHHDEIERFGRFPYRNAALDRDPTPEEVEYVQEFLGKK